MNQSVVRVGGRFDRGQLLVDAKTSQQIRRNRPAVDSPPVRRPKESYVNEAVNPVLLMPVS
jgi:hypothetical protein